jgi:hypothetical protein
MKNGSKKHPNHIKSKLHNNLSNLSERDPAKTIVIVSYTGIVHLLEFRPGKARSMNCQWRKKKICLHSRVKEGRALGCLIRARKLDFSEDSQGMNFLLQRTTEAEYSTSI